MHQRSYKPAYDFRLGKGELEVLGAAVELPDLHIRPAELVGGVRVAHRGHDQPIFPGEPLGLPIVARQAVAGVERLDDVDVWQYLVERGPADDVAAEPVEGMRDGHQAALFLDAANGLQRRQPLRDRFTQKEAGYLPLGRADLLGHDDREWRDLLHGQRAVDGVVVGHRYAVQAHLLASGNEALRRHVGVRREVGVHVEVGLQQGGPSGPPGSRICSP